MRWICLFSFFTTLFAAPLPPVSFQDDGKIAFQNTILSKVNGKTISMMDVKKKMDVHFHQHYPQLVESSQARLQFYEMSWRQVLSEIIDQELMLSDAEEKEVRVSDGEIREELESRFGPNTMISLDKIGLTYEEAWKMVKTDLIVRRMSWWFIHARALEKVTPQDIRHAYREYLAKNPAYTEWTYQTFLIRGDSPETLGEKIYHKLIEEKKEPAVLLEALKELAPELQLSNEYVVKSEELSQAHRDSLSNLSPGEYSKPIFQVGRDKKLVGRIFYLKKAEDHPAPEFQEIFSSLQSKLNQQKIAEESSFYLEKLRKRYGFDKEHLAALLPEDFHPFTL